MQKLDHTKNLYPSVADINKRREKTSKIKRKSFYHRQGSNNNPFFFLFIIFLLFLPLGTSKKVWPTLYCITISFFIFSSSWNF